MSLASEFKVMVGNGVEIPCASVCKGVPIKLQSNSFEVDLYVMPLSGADVILGVQWLKTLGPVLTDYDNLTMKFISDGKLITINADVSSAASEISLHQLKRVTATASAAAFFHLSLHILQPPSPPTNQLPVNLTTILTTFQHLLEEPTTLPPPRSHDHSIHLKPSSRPINVKPYRYPYFQIGD